MSLFKRKNKPMIKELFNVSDKNAPFSYVESYKMLCTNIEFISVAQKCKSIMITSTLADEGKTNCAVNLALTLSGYGKKVCLVECDLRRPSVHGFIDSKRNIEGLTNVLKGEIDISKALRKVSDTTMSILLAGVSPPNPSELLASEKMKWVVEELEKEYDYIIYDTPPALIVTDAAVLGKHMDGAIMVIKHNSTEKSLVNKTKSNLENAGVKIFGAILSEYSTKSVAGYSGYSAYNYYYYGKSEDIKND